MNFKLTAKYQPTGDQPHAIAQLVDGLDTGEKEQTLLGVTGSGKTFTMANIIAARNAPTLVLAHNKTLAAQLFSEFKAFFPDNEVHSHRVIPISRRTRPLTRRLIACVMPQRRLC